MSRLYESKKERINTYLKGFAKNQIKSVPEDILLAQIAVDVNSNKDTIKESLRDLIILGLIDKDKDGYYGVSARVEYIKEIDRREKELQEEIKNAPKSVLEAKEYIKNLGNPED